MVIFVFIFMNDYYDVTIKHFADGSVQYRASLIYIPYKDNYVLSPGKDKQHIPDPVRSAKNSYNRSVEKLYDIIHANIWDWFFTLTLDDKKVGDRFDYVNCISFIQRFTDIIYRRGGLYVVVPERHKSRAWHFHGLMRNLPADCFELNDNGYFIFSDYDWGYCSADRVIDSQRAANYILKYMVKGYNYLDIPKGKKRYWASRGLDRPDIDHDVFTQDQIEDLLNNSFYNKEIDNDFYKGYIIDVRE